ncbi:hypothetical protein MASR2M78_12820 [Treponema sp.]
MNKRSLGTLYLRLVKSLSFSAELYKFRRDLNARIDIPDNIAPGPFSHPLGVSRWFKKRRISIAETYLLVVGDLRSQHSKTRLRALRMMIDTLLHAKTLDLPLNTARVQMALIKGAIKNRGNSRRQLELLHDFSVSSHGQNQVIRRLLDELNLIELPETEARLKNLDAGWDGHVQDIATSGRKNPTQLLIDAFIKGISELTIAYNSASSIDMMMEAVDAGKIIGIHVYIGLEFSTFVAGARFHFMAILPLFKSGKETARWFKENAEDLKELFVGLEKNQESRAESVRALLKYFNENALEKLNEGFPRTKLYTLPRLKIKDLKARIPSASINRMHLGEFLYNSYRPILFNRVLMLKARYQTAVREQKRKRLSASEVSKIKREYEAYRAEYINLNPEQLRKTYFTNPVVGDYHTVFTDLKKMKGMLSKAGCSIRVVHPLEHGLKKALSLLEKSHGLIDEIELYNIQDLADRNLVELNEFAISVNNRNAEAKKAGLQPYVPVCGSDSTGRNYKVPGMGFVRENRLIGKYKRNYAGRQVSLPPLISAMIDAKGESVSPEDVASTPKIFCMGKATRGYKVFIGDEGESARERIPLSRAWRYLNPSLVNFMYVLVGFVIAQQFIGVSYALLWFFITGFRNSIADLIAGRGTRIREWNLKSVNFGNVSRSLFWSGLSVPILGFVKAQFDVFWPGAIEGLLFESVKFFFISFANGLYLVAHNTLRGFGRKVVIANFFRSVLSWPFATITAPIGSLLGIPTIVQAKIWSDFMAGFIEGGAKYLLVLKLRRRDLEKIVPQVISGDEEDRFTALLDLLYLFREEPRTRSSLNTILAPGYRPLGIFKFESDLRFCTGEDLYKAVMDKRFDSDFVDFLLTRYPQDMSIELLDLVTITLPLFRTWLASHTKRFRKMQV